MTYTSDILDTFVGTEEAAVQCGVDGKPIAVLMSKAGGVAFPLNATPGQAFALVMTAFFDAALHGGAS